MSILASDRVFLVGQTGRGKSVLARHIFSDLYRDRRGVVIDPKADMRLGLPDAAHARGPAAFAKALEGPHRIVRYTPINSTPAEYGEVYAAIFARREPIVTWTDELRSTGTAQTSPQSLRILLVQGRSRHKGHIGVTQRPVLVAPEAFSEAEHIIVMPPPPTKRDLATLAPEFEGYIDGGELGLRRALLELPDFNALWLDKRRRVLTRIDPVPLRGA